MAKLIAAPPINDPEKDEKSLTTRRSSIMLVFEVFAVLLPMLRAIGISTPCLPSFHAVANCKPPQPLLRVVATLQLASYIYKVECLRYTYLNTHFID